MQRERHGLIIPSVFLECENLSVFDHLRGGWPTPDPLRPLGCPILEGLVYARVGLGLLHAYSVGRPLAGSAREVDAA